MSRRAWLGAGIGVVGGAAVAGIAVWYLVLRDVAEPATVGEAGDIATDGADPAPMSLRSRLSEPRLAPDGKPRPDAPFGRGPLAAHVVRAALRAASAGGAGGPRCTR